MYLRTRNDMKRWIKEEIMFILDLQKETDLNIYICV